MKNRTYKYSGFFALFLIFLSSCQLSEDLDEFEPLYSLPAETAIHDETSAELALAGMYASLQGGAFPDYSIMGSTLSGVDAGGYFRTNIESLGFQTNNPVTSGRVLRGMYTGLYTLINRANWVIEGTNRLEENLFMNNGRKAEIIAEAKTMRALGHFYLLRLYGQFYDTSSEYGVVVNLKPSKEAEPKPRSTVMETYEAILMDLDDAIANAPTLRAKYFANKTFAKSLKAKVNLYMGNYSEAAQLSKEIIDNSGGEFALTPTFEELFIHTEPVLNNSGAIFDVYQDLNEPIGLGNYWSGIEANTSNIYYNLGKTGTMTVDGQEIKFDNTRIPFMQQGLSPLPGLNGNFKFKPWSGGGLYETLYHMRMAEVYLIYAEAAARSTNSVPADALDALNTVRIRAGATEGGGNGFVTYPQTISYEQFLEAVRIEKLMELGTEMGEEWYDLVRYDYADGFGTGFRVTDHLLKETEIPNPDKFILPIPDASITAGKGVVVQNPSY